MAIKQTLRDSRSQTMVQFVENSERAERDAAGEPLLPDRTKTAWRVQLASVLVVLDVMNHAEALLKAGTKKKAGGADNAQALMMQLFAR